MNVAILGVGTVGSSVIKILQKNKDLISARAGKEIIPVVGTVRDLNKDRGVNIPLTDDIKSVLNRDDIDIYVELMGGVEKPFSIVSEILKKKKPVVTANKAMLAYHRYALQNLAKDTPFGFEASVAGGIPIIKALREGLSANRVEKIVGILNGTSNYILTDMMQNNSNFEDVLKKAQSLGYAEADPTFDVDGIDAAHKLLILSSIAYGVHGDPEDILVKGIRKISNEDIFFAKEFDYTIKLLGISKITDGKAELRVHPALINKDKIIAEVDGVMNAVSINCDALNESMYYGPGAGGDATASAVIADLIDIAKGNKNPMLGYAQNFKKMELIEQKNIQTKYYLRVKVEDRTGVLASITNVMSQNNISIDSFLQKPRNKGEKHTTLYFTTHLSLEANIKRVMGILENFEFVLNRPFMIRIEE
ncbi:homoserine dehydrogenase [Campylobacter ureolyticus]|uniref:Homoserine dehydrogenase n=1 Tax=Campylobacter ureolyticus TaxID=827 RepID=A0A2I1N8Q9_9BACT|nr:homoserine dehydrogenase [Campylobacter ureolyticus]MCZ6106118.1 homoserine dehydrogenase [Campylobacter ureolyticus]MCZ6135370.1 homoserine dehydrogenase [Campylobacter ureolyticus]MCZ6158723.1 homoserine dehydrogenase [Campylobacter ureolyticus]MCZ6162139.1 homoserine dehydrogenase [Campylobacter ureolyticus]MCZ6167725.1 homoserine dehydrogenase [Campylobacter ureolyticus]